MAQRQAIWIYIYIYSIWVISLFHIQNLKDNFIDFLSVCKMYWSYVSTYESSVYKMYWSYVATYESVHQCLFVKIYASQICETFDHVWF